MINRNLVLRRPHTAIAGLAIPDSGGGRVAEVLQDCFAAAGKG